MSSFNQLSLDNLNKFLASATAVVPYKEAADGTAPPGSVAMRHDVDHDIEKALQFAEWEHHYGYRSTYFLLHSANYYTNNPGFDSAILYLRELGHEIGLHNDALCACDGNLGDAVITIQNELNYLRNFYPVVGIADHGGSPFKNGDIWNSYTPAQFTLEYEAYQLQKTANTYISDNQGTWRAPLKHAQTFMLIHPIWWSV